MVNKFHANNKNSQNRNKAFSGGNKGDFPFGVSKGTSAESRARKSDAKKRGK